MTKLSGNLFFGKDNRAFESLQKIILIFDAVMTAGGVHTTGRLLGAPGAYGELASKLFDIIVLLPAFSPMHGGEKYTTRWSHDWLQVRPQ
jgi:hypothetical protein